MSNNLFSQHLSSPNMQTGHDSVLDKPNSPVPHMRLGTRRPAAFTNPALHNFTASDQQMVVSEPMHNDLMSNKQTRNDHAMSNKDGLQFQQFVMPNQNAGRVGALSNDIGSPKSYLPIKRKADAEPMFSHTTQQSSAPNKRVAQMDHNLHTRELSQQSSFHKKSGHAQSMPSAQNLQTSTAASKKMTRNDSISSKSGSQRLLMPKGRPGQAEPSPKGRPGQAEPSPKGQNESFEAVRSRMRESLAAALALACQHQDEAPNEGKISGTSEPAAAPADTPNRLVEKPMDNLVSRESSSADKLNDAKSTSDGQTCTDDRMKIFGDTDKSGFQCSSFFPYEEVSFSDHLFVKDDLLQGNGLSWAFDLDSEAAEKKEVKTAEKTEGAQPEVRSPESLAFKIEAELFKLFGGVNKKYREKGRSLLFNLKDRNNPELRERVMCGEISPERLCSMTAEELASKELSQWRMAKAEELAQMVVLPDSDVDMRRLVKKTHKGEYQVEVEQDDGVSVEVSVGSTMLIQNRPKSKEAGAHSLPETADESKNKESTVAGDSSRSEIQDVSGHLTIPHDGTDLMQGLMVEDMKDEDFLPPIVSLDEFMESLNSEPPFENLRANDEQSALLSQKETDDEQQPVLLSEKENPETINEVVENDPSPKDHIHTDNKPERAEKLEVHVKASESPVERVYSPIVAPKVEKVWEGALQLSIAATVTVGCLFRSGEKAPCEEWSRCIEIKGRVRPEAFEKFVQELPMSRSRAVMVVQFVSKEGSSKNEISSLNEAIESYVVEERLGYAEPSGGVELYLCPPRGRIFEMITKNLIKNQTDFFNFNNSSINGLIGVIVWRKPHLISPNSSSSHHKHGYKQQQNHGSNLNVQKPKAPASFGPPPAPPEDDDDDDDDDVPPGFGPARGEEDDLPEFNFSGNLNSNPRSGSKLGLRNQPEVSRAVHFQAAKSAPVDQMRELILKYGQSGGGFGPQRLPENRIGRGMRPPWREDDDDMPEWRPEAPPLNLHPQPPPPLHAFRPPPMPLPGQLQPPFPQPPPARYNGMPAVNWRPDAPRSRGF